MSLVKHDVERFVVDSNEALELKLVRELSDVDDETKAMKPEMTHQVFGNSESIFGYKDLKVKLYYSACKLTTYLGMTYSEKVDSSICDVEPDNVLKSIAEKLPPGFHTNIDDFCNALPDDANFKPFGELKQSFTVQSNKDSSISTYEVYIGDIKTPELRDYHERLQTFILWYIDAGSYIDADDDPWRFFFIFEKYMYEGSPRYAVVGYATVYLYYAYPANIRPRISQMLILPPFQRQGLGEKLLNVVYDQYVGDNSVLDITVEDPSDEFQRLRDYVDAKNCSKLPSFQPEELQKGYSESMETEAREKFKINKKQSRRVYEILRLKHTDCKDTEAYKNYRLNVKQRLNVPFQKLAQEKKKLQALLKIEDEPSELTLTTSQRIAKLNEEYIELEAEYRHIIEKLAEA